MNESASQGFLFYILPDSEYAIVVIGALILLGVLWVVLLLQSVRRIRLFQSHLGAAEDISILEAALRSRHTGTKPLAVLDTFAKSVDLPRDDPLIQHAETVFLAYWYDQREDWENWGRVTLGRAFTGNELIQRLLSVFIVVGLLGTLIGLAHSLAHLSPSVLLLGEGNSSGQLEEQLQKLFAHLKTAFAPSIWGVTMTILGVVGYSFYSRFICQPLGRQFEQSTHYRWRPRFLEASILSDKQRVMLERVEAQLSRTESIAGTMCAAAKDLKDATGEIKGFAKSFSDGTEKLLSFRSELQKLYSAASADSSSIRATLDNINKDYLRRRKEEQDSLKALIKTASDTIAGFQKGLEESFSNIVNSSNAELRSLGDVLDQRLNSIAANFAALDAPLRQAAQDMAGIMESVVTRTEKITRELHDEFMKGVEERARVSDRLTGIDKSLEKFVARAAKLEEDQQSDIAELRKSLDHLTGSIAEFQRLMDSLSPALHNTIQTTDTSTPDTKVLSDNLGLLATNIADLRGVITDLTGGDGKGVPEGSHHRVKIVRGTEEATAKSSRNGLVSRLLGLFRKE
jgi:ABC-type transporter Mla subunit MlaD